MKLKVYTMPAEIDAEIDLVSKINMAKAYPEVSTPNCDYHWHYLGPDGVPAICAWLSADILCPFEGMTIFEDNDED